MRTPTISEFKAAYGWSKTWVSGYNNDLLSYVPSFRVLKEGGYEGARAMQYTAYPGPFAPSVEQRVVDKVHALVREVRTVPK